MEVVFVPFDFDEGLADLVGFDVGRRDWCLVVDATRAESFFSYLGVSFPEGYLLLTFRSLCFAESLSFSVVFSIGIFMLTLYRFFLKFIDWLD